jgi:hypothetical protein
MRCVKGSEQRELGKQMSVHDVVDGSSTGTRVPWMWALLRLPRFRGAKPDSANRDVSSWCTFRTCQPRLTMSVIEGKADLPVEHPDF